MAGRAPSRLFNRIRILLDRDLTVANALDRACEAHPDTPVFHLEAELPYRRLAGLKVTPRRLLEFVNRLGSVLLAAGMERHDRVGIFKANSPDYFFVGLAIIRAGGIAVPVNPGMGIEALVRYVESTGARWLITDAEHYGSRVQDVARLPGIRCWFFPHAPAAFPAPHIDLDRAMEEASEDLAPVPLAPDSDVLIVHTSGTTGFPKGVLCTSGSLVRGVKGHYLDEPITTRNRIAVAGHFNHLVYYLGFLTSLLGNFETWTIARLEAAHILDVLEEARIHIFFAFPDIYLGLLDEGLDDHDLSSLRIWIATADTSHEIHMQSFCRKGAFLRVLGMPLVRSVFIEALGTSEIGFAALKRIRFSFSPLRLDRRVGWPSLGGPRVKIADEEGRRVPRGRVGRLMVKGGTLFKGYWNDHAGLHRVMLDGWWWTGDLCYRDQWGSFYHLDRAADVIRTPAGPVYTLPIEELLLSHPAVAEVAVFGTDHEQAGEAPVCVVQPKRGQRINPEELRAWANDRLPPASGIATVSVVSPSDIPRGVTGKVLKRALREHFTSSGPAAEPGDRSRAGARS